MNHEHIKNFNEICIKLIGSLFGHEFSCDDKVTPEPTPSFPSKFMVQIGLRNRNNQVSLILGVTPESTDLILSDVCSLASEPEEQTELAKSALGELCNTIACEFAMNAKIMDEYGKLLPTPPLVWITEGATPDFIEGDGLSGQISYKENVLFTHLSVSPPPNLSSKEEAGNWSPTQSLSIYDPHSYDDEK